MDIGSTADEGLDRHVLRGLRVAGGAAAAIGIACAVQAASVATWLRMHYTPRDPLYAVDRFAAEDTLPRTLSDLSERGWVYAALALLVTVAVAAASKSTAIRRAAATLTLPVLALAVIVVLNAQGTIRWWGPATPTRYDDDRFLTTSTAFGGTWALTAAALLTFGALLLALTPAERRGASDDLQLQRVSGYAG
jgi:hypothetical protein